MILNAIPLSLCRGVEMEGNNPRFVIKRDKSQLPFDSVKIENALFKAFGNVYMNKEEAENRESARLVTHQVVEELRKVNKEALGVEEIQDIVEMILMKNEAEVAKAYILYRNKHQEIRAFRTSLGIPHDDLKVPINSLIILAARYLLKDADGKIIESPKQLFQRVARAISGAEKRYGKSETEISRIEQEFYDVMTAFKFMPNSPTLMNAGTKDGQLSACFVIPVGDSIEEIFDAIKWQALIHKTGGGTGFAFSRLRPSNDFVRSTSGVASGPVSFMKIFDAATEEIKQGGKRRGANMGILKVDHPNILDFIVLKESEGTLRNFNISVGITDEFMKAVKDNKDYVLKNPRGGVPMGKLNAKAVWNLIVTMAWKTGDPGLVFLDRINASYANPVPKYGPIESTNPCITGDTLISTADGIYTAEELNKKATPLNVIVDSRFGRSTTQFASPVVKTGTKPVFRLQTKEGFSIKVTKEHKILTEANGWLEAQNLKPGERIRVSDTGGAFGAEGTAEQGRVLGWLVGDGHINRYSKDSRAVLSFYNNDIPLAEQFARDVNSVIRHTNSRNKVEEVGVVTVQERNLKSIASERLLEFVQQYGLVENKLQVPLQIFKGTESIQKGFLQALFEADGTVYMQTKSQKTVRLTSVSEELLKQVQLLLLNFGVYSRIYRNRKKAGTKMMPSSDRIALKEYKVQAFHELSIGSSDIATFAAKIGFLSEHKTARLHEVITTYKRGPYGSTHGYCATFESLTEEATIEVYDLQEPTTHSFVANGFVVANCGEQPLYPFDSCNLGSINLAKMVKKTDHHYEVDWDELRRVTRLGVRFLDNVVEQNVYPLKQIDQLSRAIRRIGLGVMGWADMLIKLGIRYDSNEALMLGEKVMQFVTDNGRKMSEELAEERGAFPEFPNSVWARLGFKPLRNSTITTIAPTGTISIISGGTSQGVEPIFSVVYMRNVRDTIGSNLIEVNNEFEQYALEEGFYSEELMQQMANKVSIQDIEEVPEKIRRLFVTAFDIAPEWHVKMQAVFQKYTDNGVSKTINFPSFATPADIEHAYELAWELGCKGITVYRDQSKSIQVLQPVTREGSQKGIDSIKKAHAEREKNAGKQTINLATVQSGAQSYTFIPDKATKCPECGGTMIAGSGCFTCPKCSYSKCE